MAKKKKLNMTKLIVACVGVVLSVLVICTLFMPVFKMEGKAAGVDLYSSNITGADVLTACFTGEVSTDLSSGASILVRMKNSSDNGFVTGFFCWTYFLTLVFSAVSLVLTLLSVIGIRLEKIGMLVVLLTIILALLAFIFGLILPGKFASLDWGSLAKATTSASAAVYLMLAGVVGALACGSAQSSKF